MQAPKPDKPSSLISYVVQRHGQLTLACETFERLDIPMRKFSMHESDVDIPAENVFRNYQVALAFGIHPEVIEWFGMHARSNLAECRFLANHTSTKKLSAIEDLIQRDIEAINGARDVFDQLPKDLQGIVLINGAKRLKTVLSLDTPRVLFSLSGTFLYAWQHEWYGALRLIGDIFGGIPAPESSAMGAIDQRLEDVEADVHQIRRQMQIAAAVLQHNVDGLE